MARKKTNLNIQREDAEALHTVAFLLDTEADNLDSQGVDVPASDMSNMTVGFETTVATMMRGIAEWIRGIAQVILG